MNKLQRASEAHDLYKELVKVLELGRLAGVKMGEVLWKLRDEEAYTRAVGSGVDTWNDFLRLPEISLSPREANRSMDIYEEFTIKRGFETSAISEVPTKALHYLLPIARGDISTEDLGRLIDNAKTLTQGAFRETLHDNRGGTRTYELVLFRRCKETNTLQKVNEIGHEHIVDALKYYGTDPSTFLIPEIL